MNTSDYKRIEQDILGFLELESGPMREVEADFLSLFKQYNWGGVTFVVPSSTSKSRAS